MDAPRASPAEAAAAVASLVAGVRSRDDSALGALAPPDDAAAQELLSAVAHNARALALRDVEARYVDQVGTVAADGSWTGVVDLTWRLGGVDEGASSADVAVGFAPTEDGLAITGFAAQDRARVPLWLQGELAVVRTDGVLVLVDGERSVAEATARRVRVGIGVVSRVLPARVGPVVVEVPATAAGLDATLGVEPGTYAGIAAVTTTPGDASDDEAPVHVFLNPDVTSALRRAGAQVVMSHELVHVFTDAVRSPVEPWLLEGFADYVALRDVRLPDRVTLGRAIEAVRRDGVPRDLPTAADFDTRAEDLQAQYEEAWLACRIIAERLGERGLVAVYDAAAAGSPLERVLAHAGIQPTSLTRGWRQALRGMIG
ncbi:hypothetical protein [Nocardioides sp. Soil774]|uniref:hypothetical protein n=1 Tax=Nocardioides sp. Soil774 TaxID=1736408 RepID=UPI000ABCC98F|nr:hypothetical protein [Nocardioides sp. Soil774]